MRNADSDANAFSDPCANAFSDANAYSDPHANAFSDPVSDPYAYAETHCDSNAHSRTLRAV